MILSYSPNCVLKVIIIITLDIASYCIVICLSYFLSISTGKTSSIESIFPLGIHPWSRMQQLAVPSFLHIFHIYSHVCLVGMIQKDLFGRRFLTFAPDTKQTSSSSCSKRYPCRSWLVPHILRQVQNCRNLSVIFQYFFFASIEERWYMVISFECIYSDWCLAILFCQPYCTQSHTVDCNAMLEFIKNKNCENENFSIPKSWSSNNMMRIRW